MMCNSEKIWIKNARILDAENDYTCCDVLIDGEHIASVGREICADDARVIDLAGATLMPCFIDNHIHVCTGPGELSDEVLIRLAENGICAVKDLGLLDNRPLEDYMEWLRAQDVPGKARVTTAGRYIDVDGGYGMGPIPDFHWGMTITTPEEAADKVTYQAENGVDGIKIGLSDGAHGPILAKLSPEFIRAIADRAHSHGLWTSAHLGKVEDLRTLVENGFDEAAHTPADELMDDALIALMVERGVPMTTTVGTTEKIEGPLPFLPPIYKTEEEFRDVLRHRRETNLHNLLRFYEGGGTICMGTDLMHSDDFARDAVIPIWELVNLRELGIPMKEVIKTGTINAAKACRFDDEGLVRAGMRADLLAFPGELSEDFSQLLHPPFVMNRGKILKNHLP